MLTQGAGALTGSRYQHRPAVRQGGYALPRAGSAVAPPLVRRGLSHLAGAARDPRRGARSCRVEVRVRVTIRGGGSVRGRVGIRVELGARRGPGRPQASLVASCTEISFDDALPLHE